MASSGSSTRCSRGGRRRSGTAWDASPTPDPGGATVLIAGGQFIVLLALGVPVSGVVGVNAGFGVLFAGVATAISGLLTYKWLSAPRKQEDGGLLARNRARADEDPVFLIEEVQSYVRDQIDAVHERFASIRTQFEREVIRPRREAETTLIALCQKRLEARNREFPDEERILARIDGYIAQCERVLSANTQDERAVRQLRETGEQLRALYKYPAQLEYVKSAYRNQEEFVAGVDRIGGSLDSTETTRASTMSQVTSQLGELRREIGLTNKLVDGFRDYLATQPDLQGVVATAAAEKLMDALEGSTVLSE